MSGELGVLRYEIERSINGLDFTLQSKIEANATGGIASYHWVDIKPAAYNYYRVRAMRADGSFTYSKVVMVKFDATKPELKIFPNPVTSQLLQLSMKAFEAGKYILTILNTEAQQVYTTTLQHSAIESHTVYINRLPAGNYIIYLKKNTFTASEIMIIK